MNLFKDIHTFLFPRKEELYFSLKEILTFTPHNLELYKQALLHKSMLKTDSQGRHIDNERLEFLGDAIIEAVVSNYLFRKYGEEQEGFLTTSDKAFEVIAGEYTGISKHVLGGTLRRAQRRPLLKQRQGKLYLEVDKS